MNDIDRSIDSFDMALRRRFFWIQTKCNYSLILSQYPNSSSYKTACENLNKYIQDTLGLGGNYQLGHAYFLKIEKLTPANLEWLWEHHLEPLIREYLRSLCNDSEAKTHLEEMKKIFQLSDKK